MKKASIYTIAREAGVSTATVSKIVNNHGNISQETSARVLEIIKRHNYIPQQRKQSENAIGVMTFMNNRRPLASPFTGRLLNGVCLQSFDEGKDMILIDGDRLANATPDELYCYYASNSLAGLLVCNKLAGDPFCTRLRESGVPFVLLANPAAGTEVNFIATRNCEAVSELVDYMICLGHRRIAYLGLLNEQFDSHRDRLRAFRDTHARHGIELRPEFVLDLPNAETTTLRNTVLRLLARKEPPTALFIASEECEKAFPLLSEMKIDVPNTLSVAGMRMERDDAGPGPDYSCIIQPTEMIGRRGVLALLELAAGKRNSVHELLDNAVNYGETIRRIG
ncbi:MAG: LacI family DNA-binding transcriptional regulator [Lentisphaeria bacterium]|nr:LacI family DNA-binding transcriptional regulator [Lentisphaeria bacterium]